jgi:predicted transcriptional regulator
VFPTKIPSALRLPVNLRNNFRDPNELQRLQSKLRDRDLSVERLKNEKFKLEEDLKSLSKGNYEFSDSDANNNPRILEENRTLEKLNEDLKREIQEQKEMLSKLIRDTSLTPHFNNK